MSIFWNQSTINLHKCRIITYWSNMCDRWFKIFRLFKPPSSRSPTIKGKRPNWHCLHQGQQWNYSDGWRRDQGEMERIIWDPTECRKWKGRAWAHRSSARIDTIGKWHWDKKTTVLGRNKACGPDDLPIEAIMVVAEMKPELLTYIMQRIMADDIPDSWKKSKFIPIFKTKVSSSIATITGESSWWVTSWNYGNESSKLDWEKL